MPLLNKTATADPEGAGTTSARSPLSRVRTALTVFFALDGLLFAGWVVRIPAIKEQTGASASDLGMALLGVSAGAVATMALTGRLCRRYGSPAVTVACAAVLSLSMALPPLAHSATALGLALLVFGAGYGGINVAMNSVAVDLVAALRRPVMPSFHAAFSLGGMLGAGLGGLAAGSVPPSVHLPALGLLGLAATAAAGPALLRAPSAPAEPADPVHAGPRAAGDRTRGPVLLLGLIALCTAYGEGAMADWSALHLQQDLHAPPGVAAAAYALFALAMTAGRLTGARLLERWGQTRTLVAGGTAAAAGMLLGALAPNAWLALAGFGAAGLGLANIFPVAVGRAGELAGPGGVATASTLGYGGMLVGPPAIGFLAEWSTLPTALTTVAVLAAGAAVLAYATRNASAAPAARAPEDATRRGGAAPVAAGAPGATGP
ncbi:MFS transporter [Streptomyces sp. C10-9-1]|uniref:MFS transporter n=1 Tax=Streptomyces sp. C10-9-1 TaxID=1859285 RepID=UPI00211181F4|nr:MFS transporter [Streptomyces sp. C10-9-1]MCQ6554695.1 MFS transporter [Streptomyces sp. C10-9-1]